MLYAIAAALALIADQLLKYWTTLNLALGEEFPLIDGIIHLTNVHNTGSAFSFLGGWAGARWLFLALTVVFLVIVVMGFVKNIIRHPLGKLTAALVTAGALGNAIDRALYGFVVDMFEVEFMSFAVFNIADIFITCCGILFCVHVIFCKDSLVFEGDKVDTSDMSFDDELAPRTAQQGKKRAAAPVNAAAKAAPAAGMAEGAPKAAPVSRPAPKARPIPVFDPANPFAEWENPQAAEEKAPAFAAAEESPVEVPAETPAAPVFEAEPAPAEAPAETPVEVPAAPEAEPEFISIPVPEAAPAAEPQPQEEPAETYEVGGESFSLDDILAEFSDN